MARDEVWDALKNHAKQVHSERVAKNPDRIAYAIQQFEAHGIEYQLKNEQTGHFHCWRKSDDKLFQFYAGTGKIQGFTQVRGTPMEKQIDICATCVHDEPGYCSVIGTIPHCCSRHWHCEPGKAAKDYVPKQEEGEADVR